jgi:hypothetical protein
MLLLKGRFGSLPGILAALAFQTVTALGIIIRDDQPDSAYLALAAQSEYAAVGTFLNDWGYTGSGVLIAPDWVLTAAHNLALATAGTFTINDVSYTSTALLRHPSYVYGNSFAGYDVGLVHLSSEVSSLTPVMPYTGSDERGQIATFVGCGFTGTGLTGWQNTTSGKRAFQNVVDGDFGNPAVLLASDFDNPHSATDSDFGNAVPLPLEGSVAPGDSGGGVFITIGSQTYLAGVISFVASRDGNANGDYGDVSGFGRVSAFMPWVTSVIPEPASSALLTEAGLALLVLRRFRLRWHPPSHTRRSSLCSMRPES